AEILGDKAAVDVLTVARVVLIDRDHIARVPIDHRYRPITGRLLRVGAVECERGHGHSQRGDSGQHQCNTKMPQAHRLLLGFRGVSLHPAFPIRESGAPYPAVGGGGSRLMRRDAWGPGVVALAASSPELRLPCKSSSLGQRP